MDIKLGTGHFVFIAPKKHHCKLPTKNNPDGLILEFNPINPSSIWKCDCGHLWMVMGEDLSGEFMWEPITKSQARKIRKKYR